MCKCSWRTRIIGYVVCFAIGWILSIIATMIFFIKHNIVLFAILFSIGQVLNITGYNLLLKLDPAFWPLLKHKLKICL